MEAKATFILLFILMCMAKVSSVNMKIKIAILDQTTTLTCSLVCSGPLKWKTDEDRPVIDCKNGHCQAGKGFEGRVRIQEETVDGKHSLDLIFDTVKFNDRGGLVGICDEQYCDYKLEVLIPVDVNVPSGHSTLLPCFADIKKDFKTGYTLWEKDGETVLQLDKGHLTYGSMVENRVSISEDEYKDGNLSLYITNVRPSDQGVYHCHYSPTRDTDNFRGGPNSVKLIVQEERNPWPCAAVTIVTLISALFVQVIIYGLYKATPHLIRHLQSPRLSVPVQNDEGSNLYGDAKDSTVRPTD